MTSEEGRTFVKVFFMLQCDCFVIDEKGPRQVLGQAAIETA